MDTNKGGSEAMEQASVEESPRGSGNPPAEVAQFRAKKDEFEKAIRQVEKHLRKQNGRLELDVNDAKQAGVDPTLFQVLKESLDETNKRVKAGELRVDAVQLETPEAGDAIEEAVGPGYTGIQTFWWGNRVFLNEPDTHILTDLLKGAATTAVITGMLTNVLGAVPSAIVAGIIAIAALTLVAICGWGAHKGIYFNFAWPAVPWGVWHQ